MQLKPVIFDGVEVEGLTKQHSAQLSQFITTSPAVSYTRTAPV
jgi:hypothetical protein